MTAVGLQDAWARVFSSSGAPLALQRIMDTPAGRVYAGADSDARRVLIVPAPFALGRLPGPFPSLTLSEQQLVIEGTAERRLLVRCEDRSVWDEFLVLGEDLLDEIREARDPARTALVTIEKWRRLFTLRRKDALGQEQRMGLFAELCLLRAACGVLRERALDSWVGPRRAPHDFVFPARCVEVKAVGQSSESVRIHGLGQLEPVADRPLTLAVCVLAEDSAGSTIAELIDEMEVVLDLPGEVESRAIEAGWTRLDLDQRFQLLSWMFMDVVEDFPRIVPADLIDGSVRPGVHSVGYGIALERLMGFLTTTDLQGFVGGLGA